MIEVAFTLPAVNTVGLDTALRVGLNTPIPGPNTLYQGVAGRTLADGTISGAVLLLDSALPADVTTVQGIVAAHNPATLTPDQQAAQTATADRATIKQQLDTQVAQLKAMNPTDLATAIAAIKQNSHVLGLILNALRNQWV